MRKQYLDVVRSRLRSGGWTSVLDAGLKALGPLVPSRTGHAESGPILGTAILSYACNYRCTFCELPQRFVRRRKEGLYAYYSVNDPSVEDLCRIMCDRLEAGASGVNDLLSASTGS